ncbi:hypothetical protein CABS01_15192 [Colletotrichum abscissum]|uniref:Uncharacterized protein n=1 Tax=Colletotrichum abscissum TaxID=1671311 RepID=A0A9Q0AZP1_9PEZI|nr:uncharacterized protein CABS01_15192 [Colletotrichum abscissum]KAI3542362.1 hypothetical protein CABS02_10425 [Colletotrichum abscissum]KAK1476908.1 hypothetical protein CABS01_15192 [Colletotrichum abscissum]
MVGCVGLHEMGLGGRPIWPQHTTPPYAVHPTSHSRYHFLDSSPPMSHGNRTDSRTTLNGGHQSLNMSLYMLPSCPVLMCSSAPKGRPKSKLKVSLPNMARTRMQHSLPKGPH